MAERGVMDNDEVTADDIIAEQEAQEPALTEWSLRRQHMTKTERAQWILRVGAMASQGKSLRYISAELGMSPATAMRMSHEFWKTVMLPHAEESRKREIAIVDEMIDRWLPPALAGDKDSAAVVMKLLDRRAKLTGSDAPVKVEAQVVEVTQADLEMQQLIMEMEQQNAAKLQEIKSQD